MLPTNDGNGASPTTTVNASQGLDVTKLTPEQLESHPHVQDLKKKDAAAHTKMDESNLKRKQLEIEVARLKVLAGEKEQEPEELKPSFVTKEELKATLWEETNAKDLELYGDDQYKKELEEGVPKATALRYAKLRHQKDPNHAQTMRQQSMASPGSTSTRDLSSIDITDEDREDMKKWGYSEKTLLKQKAMKKARG